MLDIGGRAFDGRGDVVDVRGRGGCIGAYRGGKLGSCCWPCPGIALGGPGETREPGADWCWIAAVAEGERANEVSKPGV